MTYQVEDIMNNDVYPVETVEQSKEKIRELFKQQHPDIPNGMSMQYMTAYFCLMKFIADKQVWDCACHLTR